MRRRWAILLQLKLSTAVLYKQKRKRVIRNNIFYFQSDMTLGCSKKEQSFFISNLKRIIIADSNTYKKYRKDIK